MSRGGTRFGAGRPKMTKAEAWDKAQAEFEPYLAKLHRKQLMVYGSDYEVLLQFGNGNASEGLRQALDFVRLNHLAAMQAFPDAKRERSL